MSTLLRTTSWYLCVLVDCTRCCEYFVQLFEAWTWLVCMLACLRLCVTSQLSRATLRNHAWREKDRGTHVQTSEESFCQVQVEAALCGEREDRRKKRKKEKRKDEFMRKRDNKQSIEQKNEDKLRHCQHKDNESTIVIAFKSLFIQCFSALMWSASLTLRFKPWRSQSITST